MTEPQICKKGSEGSVLLSEHGRWFRVLGFGFRTGPIVIGKVFQLCFGLA